MHVCKFYFSPVQSYQICNNIERFLVKVCDFMITFTHKQTVNTRFTELIERRHIRDCSYITRSVSWFSILSSKLQRKHKKWSDRWLQFLRRSPLRQLHSRFPWHPHMVVVRRYLPDRIDASICRVVSLMSLVESITNLNDCSFQRKNIFFISNAITTSVCPSPCPHTAVKNIATYLKSLPYCHWSSAYKHHHVRRWPINVSSSCCWAASWRCSNCTW